MNPTSLETQAQEIFYLTKRVIALETEIQNHTDAIVFLNTLMERIKPLEEARHSPDP